MSELANCPFCGDRDPEITGDRVRRWIACTAGSDCGVRGPMRGSEAEAITAWNLRASPASPAGVSDKGPGKPDEITAPPSPQGEWVWRSIESAPRDGTVIWGDHDDWPCPLLVMYRYGEWGLSVQRLTLGAAHEVPDPSRWRPDAPGEAASPIGGSSHRLDEPLSVTSVDRQEEGISSVARAKVAASTGVKSDSSEGH